LNDKAGVVDVIDPGQPTMFIPDDSSTGYVHEIEDRLWEDDIPVLGLIADVRVKAVWVSPSLGEEPPQPIHFLAGILEHDLRTRQDVVRRLPARIRQGEVEVDVHGRIVGMLVRGTRPTGDDLRQFFGTLEESLNERPEPT
jgi:hypothetical protein